MRARSTHKHLPCARDTTFGNAATQCSQATIKFVSFSDVVSMQLLLVPFGLQSTHYASLAGRMLTCALASMLRLAN